MNKALCRAGPQSRQGQICFLLPGDRGTGRHPEAPSEAPGSPEGGHFCPSQPTGKGFCLASPPHPLPSMPWEPTWGQHRGVGWGLNSQTHRASPGPLPRQAGTIRGAPDWTSVLGPTEAGVGVGSGTPGLVRGTSRPLCPHREGGGLPFPHWTLVLSTPSPCVPARRPSAFSLGKAEEQRAPCRGGGGGTLGPRLPQAAPRASSWVVPSPPVPALVQTVGTGAGGSCRHAGR